MFSTTQVVDLIKAHKSGDEEKFNQVIQKLVRHSEDRGNKKVAKTLRDIYARPNDIFKRYSPTSIKTIADNEYVVQSKPTFSLNDVILSKRNTTNVHEIIETWNSRKKLISAGIPHSVRLLLHGQPGTGKTRLANALASTLEMPIAYVDVSRLISSFLGETGKNIHDMFANLEGQVLFLDEFESIAKSRADDMDIGEAKRIVTALLQNLDTLSDDTLLIAATNHLEMVDGAIRRRFTHELDLDDVDLEARKKILSLYLKQKRLNDVTLSRFAKLTNGFTGHDIQQLCNKASRRSVLSLDKLKFEHQIWRQIVETKYRKYPLDKKNEASIKEFKQVVTDLRSANDKYFTYEALENITGIPDSTINYIMLQKGQ